MKLFSMVVLGTFILHLNFCQAKDEVETTSNGTSSPASVTRSPSKELEDARYASEQTLTQSSSDAFVLLDNKYLTMLIKTNNASELISAYERYESRDPDEIARTFYPETYLQTHYRFSFDQLNESAKLCILIAARHNHLIARRIIAGSLSFSEEDSARELKLRGESPAQTDEEIIAHHLETPFFNLTRINRQYLFSEKGKQYIHSLFESRKSQRNPFVLYNLGKLFVLTGDTRRAFDCYYCAGQNLGMPDGYVEAAQLILKNPSMDMSFPDIDLTGTIEEKIERLAKMAGDEGLWYLADCYRYGQLPREHAKKYMEHYVNISQKEEESFYCRQFTAMHRSIGDSNRDSSMKANSYKNAINGLLSSLNMGDIFVIPMIEEIMNKLQQLDPKAYKESLDFIEVIKHVNSQKQFYEEIRAKLQETNNKLTVALLAIYA